MRGAVGGIFAFFFIFVATPKGVQGYVFIGLNQFTYQSSLQSLQIPKSRPARRSSFSQARISAVSGERWSWRGGEDGGVVGGGGDGDDGVGGAGGESGADRRSSSSQARIRVLSQSR